MTTDAAGVKFDRFDAFLSFATEDRRKPWFGRSIDLVAELKGALERYRHPETNQRFRVCTYDEDFELDAEIRGAITGHIERSTAVLFLSTSNAANSDYVAFEIAHAAKRGNAHPLLGALVDVEPAGAFPSIFAPGTHAADLSPEGCADRGDWQRRVELEAAKIAARVWNVPLRRVRDRFAIDRRRQKLWRGGAVAIAAGLIVSSAIGVREYRKREAARVLAVHQRYAADMTAVQRAWSDGHVDQAVAILRRYDAAADPDPRSFEWSSYNFLVKAERFAFDQDGGPVRALTVSPAASWVAFSAERTPITIFDVQNRKTVARLQATAGAGSLAFMADGSRLIGVAAGDVLIWDARTRKDNVIRLKPPRRALAAACHPQQPRCAVVDEDGTIYSVAGDRLVLSTRLLFPREKELRLAFSGGGRFLVGLGGAAVHIADGAGRVRLRTVKVAELRSDVGFAVSAKRAFVVTDDHLTAVDLATGEMKSSPRLVNGTIIAGVAVDPGGRMLAAGDPSDGAVVIRDAEDWRELGSVKGYRGWLNDIHFVPRSTWLVAGSLAGDLKVWDLAQIGSRMVREQPGDIGAVLFVPGTNDVLSMDGRGWLRRWNAGNLGQHWKRRIAERLPWGSMAFHGTDVAIADGDTIRLLRAADGSDLGQFKGWAPLASSADGAVFAYVGPDGHSLVVGPTGPRPKRVLSVPLEPGTDEVDVSSLVMSPDGRFVLAGTADGRVMRFDVRTGRLAFVVAAHRGVVRAVALSPGGEDFATAGSDRTIALWDLDTGALQTTLSGHSQTVAAVTFSPDGKTLVSGGQDGLIRFWNVASRLPTVTFYAHARDLHPGVTTLTFSADGSLLMSGGALGTVVRWDSAPEGSRIGIGRVPAG
ncbi:MAG TPA: hypothetical protein VF618_12200 [Thermoanaerobaculia bacterium]